MFSGYCSRNSRSDSEQNCGNTRIELNHYELDAGFDYSCTSMHGQSSHSQLPNLLRDLLETAPTEAHTIVSLHCTSQQQLAVGAD